MMIIEYNQLFIDSNITTLKNHQIHLCLYENLVVNPMIKKTTTHGRIGNQTQDLQHTAL